MKRGKGEEKVTGPLFPRLHVNDTERGGPRAPPRNKMALYEQLTIPSHRFNSGPLPVSNTTRASNIVPTASSSQGSGQDRSILYSVHVPPSTPVNLVEKRHTYYSGAINQSGRLIQHEQRKKPGNEDDFMVPVFVHTAADEVPSKNLSRIDSEGHFPHSPLYANHMMKLQNGQKDPRQTGGTDPSYLRQTGGTDPSLNNEMRGNDLVGPKESSSGNDGIVKCTPKLSTRDKVDGPVRNSNLSSSQAYPGNNVDIEKLDDSDASFWQGCGAQSQSRNTVVPDSVSPRSTRSWERENPTSLKCDTCLGDGHAVPINHDNGNGYPSVQACNMDRGDDVSETSMVDSISGLDISPDDVVGIIGQKHFWKARRAIANQQRVFAVQVFELHRLIKVQRLIARSPNLLFEDSGHLGKPSLKSPTLKNLPLDNIVKSLHETVKHTDDDKRQNNMNECSAENAVSKPSFSSVTSVGQATNNVAYPGNPPLVPAYGDSRTGAWCFPQPPGHQWLVPVMSPSEGLIYKPYPGPGFMGPFCGGCGPLGPNPMLGSFLNPACGAPASQHYQGVGVPPAGHGYIYPHGMPVMNPAVSASDVEQVNSIAGPNTNGRSIQVSGINVNTTQQSSCNMRSREDGAGSHVQKSHTSKDRELQGRIASSPSERAHGGMIDHIADGSDVLPLFPMASAANSSSGNQSRDTGQQTRVIKVVPHNPRHAIQSAARIFRSIEEERKQLDAL
ncbi:hypothetical protein RJ641_005901 [Dillenia turbinata]|uniref:Protein EARLY FLOWERING 3 n=1 Tax=Dillenia turbinata TaxID=194707 RepID=A0AAN8V4D0_9MAGN